LLKGDEAVEEQRLEPGGRRLRARLVGHGY
jgi:hypothetical protein